MGNSRRLSGAAGVQWRHPEVFLGRAVEDRALRRAAGGARGARPHAFSHPEDGAAPGLPGLPLPAHSSSRGPDRAAVARKRPGCGPPQAQCRALCAPGSVGAGGAPSRRRRRLRRRHSADGPLLRRSQPGCRHHRRGRVRNGAPSRGGSRESPRSGRVSRSGCRPVPRSLPTGPLRRLDSPRAAALGRALLPGPPRADRGARARWRAGARASLQPAGSQRRPPQRSRATGRDAPLRRSRAAGRRPAPVPGAEAAPRAGAGGSPRRRHPGARR
jgi:hypothetical protein